MSMAQIGSIGANYSRRLKMLCLVSACFALAGCVAEHATPDISALSLDLEAPKLSAAEVATNAASTAKTVAPKVSSDKKTASLASVAAKPTEKKTNPPAYHFVTKASYGLPALNHEFPGTFGFSGNNIDHLLLGGGSSWQSQPKKNSGRVTTALVLSAGRLFYGDDKGALHAVAASNGAPLWTMRLSDGNAHQPIATLFADKNLLYAATKNGHVIAASTKNGTLHWKKKITGLNGGSVKGALRSLGDALLLQIGKNQLITLSKDKAETGWRYKSKHPISGVAVSNGAIQLLNNKNEFVHLDAATGKLKMKNEFVFAGHTSQLVATSADLIVAGNTGLRRYTPQRTKILWDQKDGVEGRIIVSGDAVFSAGIDNALRAYDRTNGKLNWRSKLPASNANSSVTRWSRPILAGGRLHLASNTGYVASFNADDGQLILLRNIKAPINSAPIVASGRLYIIAANGKVFRL